MSRLAKRAKKDSVVKKIAEGGHRKVGAPKKRKKPNTSRTFRIDDDLYRSLVTVSKDENCNITEALHILLQYGLEEYALKKSKKNNYNIT